MCFKLRFNFFSNTEFVFSCLLKKILFLLLIVSNFSLFTFNNCLICKTRLKPKTSIAIASKKSITSITDTSLAEGIAYRNLIIKNGRYSHKVHVIVLDLNKDVSAKLLLSEGKIGTLKKLQDVSQYFDSLNGYTIAGLINGSFWSKYNMFPIGTTFINGEIIELKSYKNWSAAYFDEKGKLHVRRFSITAAAKHPSGNKILISSVNRRSDSISTVLYNNFAGDSIPYIHRRSIDKIINETLIDLSSIAQSDGLYNDSTETEFNLDSLRNELLIQQRLATKEYSMRKVSLLYLTEPAINKEIKCSVISVDTGLVEIPDGGCILSLGNGIASEFVPDVGDTIIIKFSTNDLSNIKFFEGLSGTPCLVRNGQIVNEARYEGSRSRRFINRKLPRTAIGTNRAKDKIYFVCVENGNRNHRTIGASLNDMSYIMRKLGAWDALNLDGGGSSSMVIGNKNVVRNNSLESRSVVLSVAAVKRK